jgi:hypothetical protein
MVNFLNKYVCCFSKQKSCIQKKEQTVSNTNKLDNVMVDDTRMSEIDKKHNLQIEVDDINNNCIRNENGSVNGSINGSINGSENNECICVSVLSKDNLTDDDSL